MQTMKAFELRDSIIKDRIIDIFQLGIRAVHTAPRASDIAGPINAETLDRLLREANAVLPRNFKVDPSKITAPTYDPPKIKQPVKPQAPAPLLPYEELEAYAKTLPQSGEVWIVARSRNDSEGLDYEFDFARSLKDLPRALLHASGVRDTLEIEIEIQRLAKQNLDHKAPDYRTKLCLWARELTGDDYQILHGNLSTQSIRSLTRPA